MPRLYRKQPDSSAFTEPRVLARVFAEPGHFEQTVHYYEKLTGTTLDLDLDARDLGIRIAAVAAFLILELDPTQRERVEIATSTAVTMIFADLDTAIETGLELGAELITPPFPSPVGRGARLRHPDGVVVEYLEHRPGQYDTDTSML
jgi:predicted enzyme related to lactoylglutathione lyase